jgi:hypothetical protein
MKKKTKCRLEWAEPIEIFLYCEVALTNNMSGFLSWEELSHIVSCEAYIYIVHSPTNALY